MSASCLQPRPWLRSARNSRTAPADSSLLEMNPSTGVTATSSAKSDSPRVEVRTVLAEAPSEVAASCQARSKPLSPFRLTSTIVTSGSSSRTRARASAEVDATPTTASPHPRGALRRLRGNAWNRLRADSAVPLAKGCQTTSSPASQLPGNLWWELNLRDRVQAVVLAEQTGLFEADTPRPSSRHGTRRRRNGAFDLTSALGPRRSPMRPRRDLRLAVDRLGPNVDLTIGSTLPSRVEPLQCPAGERRQRRLLAAQPATNGE